jgi:hypothetical protein
MVCNSGPAGVAAGSETLALRRLTVNSLGSGRAIRWAIAPIRVARHL